MRKKFQDLNAEDLAKLRKEITLNSLFVADYKNTFGFAAKSVCSFFEGYMQYLWELANDDYGMNQPSIETVVEEYDNKDNLFDYYWNCDDYSWVEYDPEWTAEEEAAYENYWNGTK